MPGVFVALRHAAEAIPTLGDDDSSTHFRHGEKPNGHNQRDCV